MSPLAARGDVEARLGRVLTEVEAGSVNGLLDDASDTVAAFLRWEEPYPVPVPGPVRRVVARMVTRYWERPAGDASVGLAHQQDTAGPFSQTLTYADGATSGDTWLTKADKAILRPWGRRGARAVKTW